LRFDQVVALGELQIRWTGSESGEVEITDEFDIPVDMSLLDGEPVVDESKGSQDV
jgi:segregation and condensation protein A